MNDVASSGSPEKLALKDANDNPWYLLATIFGEQKGSTYSPLHDKSLQAKNRWAWNKWMLQDTSEERRRTLISNGRHQIEDLNEAPKEELDRIRKAFESRGGSKGIKIPVPESGFDGSNVRFDRPLDFSGFIFCTEVNFIGSKFRDEVIFNGSHFLGLSRFYNARFKYHAMFNETNFDSIADFSETRFESYIGFKGASFHSLAMFDVATFNSVADFERAHFHVAAQFTNAQFASQTIFSSSRFKRFAPHFFNATLHEGTFWPNRSSWPLPIDKQKADSEVTAYACLKRHMEAQKRQDDELEFYCLELQSRAIAEGGAKGFLIDLYGFFSDYGRSIARPLTTFLAVTIIGWLVIARDRAFEPDYYAVRYLGMSLANMFGPLGIRKELVGEEAYEGFH